MYRGFLNNMWEISLSGQISAFLCSLFLGAALSLFYDVIRATRAVGLNSFAAVFIGDILFFAVSAAAVFIYLVGTTNGEIRGYVLFSAAAGFLLCRITLSRAVYYFLTKLLVTLKLFLNLISDRAFKTVLFCEKPLKYLFSTLKKLLKSVYNMLYTVRDKKKPRYNADEQRR